eukprot:g11482.t1
MLVLFICTIAQFRLKLWLDNLDEQGLKNANAEKLDTKNCVIIDAINQKELKSELLTNNLLKPPFAIQSFTSNITLKAVDEVFYNVEKFLINLIENYHDDKKCNKLIERMISVNLFQRCNNLCDPVKSLCIEATCMDIDSECFETAEDAEQFSNEKRKGFVAKYSKLKFDKNTPYYKLITTALQSDLLNELEIDMILNELIKGVETFASIYNDNCLKEAKSSKKSQVKKVCIVPKNYTIQYDSSNGNCALNNLTNLISVQGADNTKQEKAMFFRCTKNCFYVSLMSAYYVLQIVVIMFFFVSNHQSKENDRRNDNKTYDECVMTFSSRGRIFFSGFIPILIGVVMYQYGYTVELAYSNQPNFNSSIFIITFSHVISLIGIYQGASCVLYGITGLAIVEIDNTDISNDTHQHQVESKSQRCIKQMVAFLKKMKQVYDSLFHFKIGEFFFEKMIVLEIFEITMQYLSLEEICLTANPNKLYIDLAFSLLLINAIISPLIMNFRQKLKERNARYLVYVFDSVIDALYLFNNTYRGGDENNKPALSLFINIAMWYPAFSIIDKMRDIRLGMSVKMQEKAISSNNLSFVQKKNRVKLKEKLEKIILFIMFSIGVSGMTALIIQEIVVFNKCRDEMTPVLYDNAYPIRLYSQGLHNPTCGYQWIETINANTKGIDYIPSIINKCINLKTLNIANNKLTNLPCSLLEMENIDHVDLSGNPVASKLDIYNCKLNVKKFPTRNFVCKHMYKTLKIIKFSNQSVMELDRCIGNIKYLHTLVAKNNDLNENGIPSTILSLNNLEILDIKGNKNILNSFSWSNEKIAIEENEKLVSFLVKFFSKSMKKLNLDFNFIKDEKTVYNILDNMTLLEHISIRSNNLHHFKEETKFQGVLFNMWPNIKTIDLSSNPLVYLSLEFSTFIDSHRILLNITNNKIVQISWKNPKQQFKETRYFPNSIYQQLSTANVSFKLLLVLFLSIITA